MGKKYVYECAVCVHSFWSHFKKVLLDHEIFD